MSLQILTARPADGDYHIAAPRFAGLPAVPDGFTWPLCADHQQPMQFTAQLTDGDHNVLVFFCQTDPGLCDSWDPDSGCNAGVVVPNTGLHLAENPGTDTAVLDGGPWLLDVEQTTDTDWFAAAENARIAGALVGGQWYGEPDWIQGDETPDGYRFVAMLMEMPFDFNFGGGWAYVFADDDGHAQVLWQQ